MAEPHRRTTVSLPGELTDDERRVVEAVDVDRLVADLADLVAFAPVGGGGGEVAVQRWCADRLRGLGLDVAEWDVDLGAEAAQPDLSVYW